MSKTHPPTDNQSPPLIPTPQTLSGEIDNVETRRLERLLKRPSAPYLAASICMGIMHQKQPTVEQLARSSSFQQSILSQASQPLDSQIPLSFETQPLPTQNFTSKSGSPKAWVPEASTCRLATLFVQAFFHIANSPDSPGIPRGGTIPCAMSGKVSPLLSVNSSSLICRGDLPNEGISRVQIFPPDFPMSSERDVMALTLAALLLATKYSGAFCRLKYILSTFYFYVGHDHPVALEVASSSKNETPETGPTASLFVKEVWAMEMMLSQLVTKHTLVQTDPSVNGLPITILPENVLPELVEALSMPQHPALCGTNGEGTRMPTELSATNQIVSSEGEAAGIAEMALTILRNAYLEPHLILAGAAECALGALVVACCCCGTQLTHNSLMKILLPVLQGPTRKAGDRDVQLSFTLLWESIFGCKMIAEALGFVDLQTFSESFLLGESLLGLIGTEVSDAGGALSSASPVSLAWDRKF